MARTQYKAGFTLVELLVVITILALLLAMIIPGVGMAFERARITGCISNLRTQGSAAMNFSADHQQRLPFFRTAAAGEHRLWGHENIGWERALAPYIDAVVQTNHLLATGAPVFICPSSSIRWDATLTHWARGPGNYRHAGIPEAGGNNAYAGLYYNYFISPINASASAANVYPQILKIDFYVSPSTQPQQWCSQRLTVDPSIGYNANTLSALSWHRRIIGRPTLFLDGRVAFLEAPIHNTLGEQTLVNASHNRNTQYNHLRGLPNWQNGGTYGLKF